MTDCIPIYPRKKSDQKKWIKLRSPKAVARQGIGYYLPDTDDGAPPPTEIVLVSWRIGISSTVTIDTSMSCVYTQADLAADTGNNNYIANIQKFVLDAISALSVSPYAPFPPNLPTRHCPYDYPFDDVGLQASDFAIGNPCYVVMLLIHDSVPWQFARGMRGIVTQKYQTTVRYYDLKHLESGELNLGSTSNSGGCTALCFATNPCGTSLVDYVNYNFEYRTSPSLDFAYYQLDPAIKNRGHQRKRRKRGKK